MNDEDLKPCPFCGGEVKAQKSEFFDVALLFFTCHECGAKVSFDDPACNVGAEYGDYSPTINAWNQRAERTCKPDDSGRCKCGTLVRWRDNCEPYETCDGLIAYKSIHPPVTRYYDYCPSCGAKVVE